MEKNISFSVDAVKSVRIKLTWAQAEVMTATADEIHLIVAGDDDSVSELRVEQIGDDLVVAQPQLAYAKEILPRRRWLEICLCMPAGWRGDLDVDNVSGLISARKMEGGDFSLTTVSGRLQASGIACCNLSLHTVSGAIAADALRVKRLHLQTISGRASVTDATFETAKTNTVGGEMSLSVNQGAKALDMQAVSGTLAVEVDGPVKAALRSLGGQFILDEDARPAPGCLEIVATSLSGSLTVTAKKK